MTARRVTEGDLWQAMFAAIRLRPVAESASARRARLMAAAWRLTMRATNRLVRGRHTVCVLSMGNDVHVMLADEGVTRLEAERLAVDALHLHRGAAR